jgi:hypothetical protein
MVNRGIVFGLCVILGLLAGCSGPMTRIESLYRDGKYLECSREVVSVLRDPSVQDQVQSFLQKNGDAVIKKAIQEGDVLSKRDETENPILYWKAVQNVLDELSLADASISQLESYQEEVDKKYDQTVSAFRSRMLESSKTSYLQHRYRAVVAGLRRAQVYGDLESYYHTLLKNAFTYSQKNIVVSPFFRPYDGVEVAFRRGLQEGGLQAMLKQKAFTLKIEEVDVPAFFNQRVWAELAEKKSEFLNLGRDVGDFTNESATYVMVGVIDVVPEEKVGGTGLELNKQTDTLEYTVGDATGLHTITVPFEYFIYTATYTLTISAKVIVFRADTGEKVAQADVNKVVENKVVYRSDPVYIPPLAYNVRYPLSYLQLSSNGIIDKKAFLKKSLELVSQDMAKAVLEKVDRE